jgi:hypothetical protein
MPDEPRLEEQAISEVIKQAILSQFDGVKRMGVAVSTSLTKAFQGQADSISVKGHELVKEDIHIQELEVRSGQVSIDPLSVFLGQIRLNEPVDTHVHLVLSEEDLNQALSSDYVLEKLPHLHLEVSGKFITIELCSPFKIRLPGNNKIRVSGTAKLYESQRIRPINFSAVICLPTETQPILLETFCCAPQQGLSVPFVIALLQKLNAIVTQPYFQLEATTLKISSLEIKDRKVTLEIEAQTHQIPSL